MSDFRLVIRLLVLTAIAGGFGTGCGGASNSPGPSGEATVKGTIKVAGTPLADGKVIFSTSSSRHEALIGADGTYSVTTNVGLNSVRLQAPKDYKSTTVANYSTTCEVAAGQDTNFNIEIASKGRDH